MTDAGSHSAFSPLHGPDIPEQEWDYDPSNDSQHARLKRFIPQRPDESLKQLLSSIFSEEMLQEVMVTLSEYDVVDVKSLLRLEEDDIHYWFNAPVRTQLLTAIRQLRSLHGVRPPPSRSYQNMISSQHFSSRHRFRRFEAVARIIPASRDRASPFTGVLISPDIILTTLHCWSAAPAITSAEERRKHAYSAASSSFVQLPWTHASLLVVTKCRPDVLFVWNASGGYCVCAVHPYLRELSPDDELCDRIWNESADGIVVDSFISLRSSPSRRLMQQLRDGPSRRWSAPSSDDNEAGDEQNGHDDGHDEVQRQSTGEEAEEEMIDFIVQNYDKGQPNLILPHSSRDRPPMSPLSREGRDFVQYKWYKSIAMGSPLFNDQWIIVGLNISRERPQQVPTNSRSPRRSKAAMLYTSVMMHSVVDDLLIELRDLLPAYARSAGDERLHLARQCLLLIQVVSFREGESVQQWLDRHSRELEALFKETNCTLDSLQRRRAGQLTHVQLLPLFDAMRLSEEPDSDDEGGDDWFSQALRKSMTSVSPPSAVSANRWTAHVVDRFLELNAVLFGEAVVRELSTGAPGPMQRSKLQHMNPMFQLTDARQREQWLCERVYTSAEKRTLIILSLSPPQSCASSEAVARLANALPELARRLSIGSEVRWPEEVQRDVPNITLVPCAPDASTLSYSISMGQVASADFGVRPAAELVSGHIPRLQSRDEHQTSLKVSACGFTVRNGSSEHFPCSTAHGVLHELWRSGPADGQQAFHHETVVIHPGGAQYGTLLCDLVGEDHDVAVVVPCAGIDTSACGPLGAGWDMDFTKLQAVFKSQSRKTRPVLRVHLPDWFCLGDSFEEEKAMYQKRKNDQKVRLIDVVELGTDDTNNKRYRHYLKLHLDFPVARGYSGSLVTTADRAVFLCTLRCATVYSSAAGAIAVCGLLHNNLAAIRRYVDQLEDHPLRDRLAGLTLCACSLPCRIEAPPKGMTEWKMEARSDGRWWVYRQPQGQQAQDEKQPTKMQSSELVQA